MINIINKFKYILILSLILFLIHPVNAETIIYDNITTSQYKSFIINDDMNFDILPYEYTVFINGLFLGKYKEGEMVFYPDNSTITVYTPSPIKTNMDTNLSLAKSLLMIAIMFILTFGVFIALIYFVIQKIRR